MINTTVVLILSALGATLVNGHGLLWEPPNRSSLWRIYAGAPENFNDNQNFCGGFAVQYEQNGGRCGPCGDNYASPVPRDNENGGVFGQGFVARKYKANTNIQVQVNITAPHKGHFEFNICELKANEAETEECFAAQPLFQLDGSFKYQIPQELDLAMEHIIYLRLPKDLKCERCVLRWHYWTGNSDGVCEDGVTHAIGCGPQEVFRSCSDISIV